MATYHSSRGRSPEIGFGNTLLGGLALAERDLVGFLAQVSASYKADIPSFHVGLIELLEKHYALLDPHLRRSLVSALILLRNRGSATAAELLPLFFKLFRCQDKQLRVMIFRHIVADVKGTRPGATRRSTGRCKTSWPPR